MFLLKNVVQKANRGLISKSKDYANGNIKRTVKGKTQNSPSWKRKEWHLVYKTLKKEVRHTIKPDSKPFWSEVKRLFDYKKNVTCPLTSGNHKITDPVQKANLFNQTFTKISKICKNKFTEEEKFHEEIERKTQGFLESKTANKWYNRTIQSQEVVPAIKHFDNNKSPGHDGIPAEFYKAFAVCWGPILAHLFSIFLETNFYPPEWGFVKVTPIFKEKGTPP